jgi:hypothetical protein
MCDAHERKIDYIHVFSPSLEDVGIILESTYFFISITFIDVTLLSSINSPIYVSSRFLVHFIVYGENRNIVAFLLAATFS